MQEELLIHSLWHRLRKGLLVTEIKLVGVVNKYPEKKKQTNKKTLKTRLLKRRSRVAKMAQDKCPALLNPSSKKGFILMLLLHSRIRMKT